jgi:hypothetical protein
MLVIGGSRKQIKKRQNSIGFSEVQVEPTITISEMIKKIANMIL